MADCGTSLDLTCRDTEAALHLKAGAISAILVASALGVTIPLVGRKLKFLRTDGNFFFVAKAFAAGVILATGFVHMLPDAQEALTNPCLPDQPWGRFPWQGFIAMVAALGTMVLDFVGTEYYERKHGISAPVGKPIGEPGHTAIATSDWGSMVGVIGGDFDGKLEKNCEPGLPEKGEGDMHIVGIRAHAASHSHSHAHGQHGIEDAHSHHAGHHHVSDDATKDEISVRHVVISQVLELGIIAHSVIIGISLGVSESPCTIRPLMAALVFHQFFEGFALGGCISQAGFKYGAAAVMAAFFAMTAPFGISVGIGIASIYNATSPHALIVEGVFDAISAGILIYMALVDLIAADFLSKRMRCDRLLQLFSYLALFAGSGAMAGLAVWA